MELNQRVRAARLPLLPTIRVEFFCFTCIFVFSLVRPSVASAQQDEFVPQWAKQVVWYQIFPERFRNGDPSNDPTVEDLKGADPQRPPKQWRIHPWTSDWYQLQDYEIANGERSLGTHLTRRRYGGDLQGIIDQLDYLQNLGITAIYLNPVFVSPSLHKYDCASYHHIDPNFGPDPAGDRRLIATENPLDPSTWVWTSADKLALQLIQEVHRRDMRIIFDGVFNHMGTQSFAFQDVLSHQQNSNYRDWFTIKQWRDPENDIPFDYEGWFGVKSLPELREDQQGIVDGPRQYIFHATQRWMNPQDRGCKYGIDGWRLDVAYCVAHPFWKAWRTHVRSINPEAFVTAELVKPPEEVVPYMQGDEFDAEMNYNFAFAADEFFFQPDAWSITPSEFSNRLASLRNAYPSGVAAVSQNLFGSHDSNRIGSHIKNRGIGHYRDWGNYFGISKPLSNPKYSARKPESADIQLQKQFVIFQMTYLGAPMIYYGDEVGMWGGNDPDCRKPMLWADLRYDDETIGPDQQVHFPDTVEVNKDLLEHYRTTIQIRNRNLPLQLGDYQTTLTDDSKGLFAFRRTYQGHWIEVYFNRSQTPQSVPWPEKSCEQITELLTGETFQQVDRLEIPAGGSLVLKPKS